VVGLHETKVEHRHQRLATRQQLGVFQAVEQADGLADGLRIVLAERRWLHLSRSDLAAYGFFTYTNGCASIQKKSVSQIWDKRAVIVLGCCYARRIRGEQG
jgi:hypothetical protein